MVARRGQRSTTNAHHSPPTVSEEIYWHLYQNPAEARERHSAFRERYNTIRPHWALRPDTGGDPLTPHHVYVNGRATTLPALKVYPVDPGLIPVYQRAGRENRWRSLETAVLIELERRGYDVGWVRVGDDLEVDFFAEHHVAEPMLLQVSLDTASETTWEREIRSLQAAAEVYPHALPLLLTLDPTPPSRPLPPRLEWLPASRWLLGEVE